MIKTAVLLTVYNRKEVTLQGLRSLHKAIAYLREGYSFDIFMTDDGCTDGTAEAVSKEFSDIHIVAISIKAFKIITRIKAHIIKFYSI